MKVKTKKEILLGYSYRFRKKNVYVLINSFTQLQCYRLQPTLELKYFYQGLLSTEQCQQHNPIISQYQSMIKSIPLTNFKLPTPRAAKNIIKAANLKRCRSQDFTNKPSDPFQNEQDHSILNLGNFQVLSSSSKPQSFASHALSSFMLDSGQDQRFTMVGHIPQNNRIKAKLEIEKDKALFLKKRLQKQREEALLKFKEISSKFDFRKEQKRQILQRSKSPFIINILQPSESNGL